jgi:hypothetical protein
MSYSITLTDGAVFATIADGTINTASSMTLVGKNYAGYGQFINDDIIRLLESGSNTTPPGAPLKGQLWFDSSAGLLKIYNGTVFKTISAATASSTAPSSNSTGDLWFDTVNQQLNVWTGAAWLLVGPQFTAGQGITGAIPATIVDNGSVSHYCIELYCGNNIVGIVSQDATFTPQNAISGFTTIRPGITLATIVGANVPLFQGTATNSQALSGLASTQFMRNDANATTSGTVGILNNGGLSVGLNSDLRVTVAGTAVTVANQTSNGNINFNVNIGGTPTTVMTINGSTGVITGNQIDANYADMAERFAADEVYLPGTVVELGGTNEITRVKDDASDRVFGVISTRPAFTMNGGAGDNETHPPVAMTGRVPVLVLGVVAKGDRLISAGDGIARAAAPGEATAFNVIGRALVGKTTTELGTVEAIVTIN